MGEDDFMFKHLLDEPDQEARLDEVLCDSEGFDKGCGSFEIYLEECFDFPFEAKFRSERYGNVRSRFTVTGLAGSRTRGGVYCNIRFKNGVKQEVPVCGIIPLNSKHKRNIPLNDYLKWLPFKP